MTRSPSPSAVSITKDYYNSNDADRFYFTVWGGEDIHIGLYRDERESIFDASRRTVELMSELLKGMNKGTRVLDIGSGYGGSARYLTGRFGCPVACLNLSEVQNQRNRSRTAEQGFSESIEVLDGSFEDLPFDDAHFDLVWSQDAILHSGDRQKVLEEVDRVLAPGGRFIFTDPMKSDDCTNEILKPVLERIHLESMGSPGFYRNAAAGLGWRQLHWEDHSAQLGNHYQRVLDEILKRDEEMVRVCSREYLESMKSGLKQWIHHGAEGHLKWGIWLFQKPE
jgi:SAM-dependent methyltransferase